MRGLVLIVLIIRYYARVPRSKIRIRSEEKKYNNNTVVNPIQTGVQETLTELGGGGGG